MTNTISVKEAARQWNLTERRVSALCKDGTIKGAFKKGRSWQIPSDTKKPQDRRIKSGAYRKNTHLQRLPLPIGISDYCLASSEYYYANFARPV